MGLLAFLFFLFFVAADYRIDKPGILNHCPTSSPRLSPNPSSRLNPGPRLYHSTSQSIPVQEMHSGSHGCQAREWPFRRAHPQHPRRDSKFPFHCPRVKSAIHGEERHSETAAPLLKVSWPSSTGPGRWPERVDY